MELLNYVEVLDQINHQIDELKKQKDNICEILAVALDAQENKSKSYLIDNYKVEIKRGRIYKIDIEKYLEANIPDDIDPVRSTMKYDINTAKLRIFEDKYDGVYSEFLTWKPAKLSVSISVKEPK